MSNKNKVYLAGLAMYLLASLSGFLISNYWIVLVIAVVISMFTIKVVFDKNNVEENLNSSLRFDWISIVSFLGLILILTVCLSVFELMLVGIVGYLNLFIQIAGYICIGYSAIRYTIENTTIVDVIKAKFNSNQTTVVSEDEVINKEVATKVEEAIKEEIVVTETHEVEVVEETPVVEPEIKGIELKVEEKEIATPYMEEEI